MPKLLALTGVGSAGGGGLPGAAGLYWHDGGLTGDAALGNLGNYAATTKLTDGTTGDHTTYIFAASAAAGMVVREVAAATTVTTVQVEVYYHNDLTYQISVWNGTSYTTAGWTLAVFPPEMLSPAWATMTWSYAGTAPATAGYLDIVISISALSQTLDTLRFGDYRRS